MLYVLGSGFSVPAGGPLLQQGLGNMFTDSADKDACKIYAWVCEHLYKHNPNWTEAVTLEEILSRLDLFIHYRVLSDKGLRKSRFVRAWLMEKFLAMLEPDTLHDNDVYSYFAQQLHHDDVIITYNYDLVLEEALYRSGVPFHYQLDQVEDSLPILKLHGSINFWQCPECNTITIARRQEQCSSHPKAEMFQLIVPPTLYKNYSTSKLRNLWTKALKAALRAPRICIIGYSFSSADCLSIQLLDYALALGQCQSITIVNGPNFESDVVDNWGHRAEIKNTRLTLSDYVLTLCSFGVTHKTEQS